MLDYARLGLARRLLIVVNALGKILVLLILPAQTILCSRDSTCIVSSKSSLGLQFNCFLTKIGHPRPLFHLFSSFQTNTTILTTNKCEKCYVRPVYGSRI